MYGADWCGDCRRAKAFFDERNVAYDYVDLVDNPDETERVLERNNGVKKIPVIVFSDDSHLVEPSNEALAAKLDELVAAGYSVETVAEASEPEPSHPGATERGAVVENQTLQRFELLHQGEVVSFASYRPNPDDEQSIVIPHVETAPEHRGNGYAAELMDGTLQLIRSSDRTVVPRCPFAAGHIRDNPEHHDLVTA